MDGYGLVVGHPDITIDNLNEEHGVLSVLPDTTLKASDRVESIPDHVCCIE